MNLEELQTDLSLFAGDLAPDPGSPLANIIEAARLVTNLHKEIDLHRLSDGLKFAHITDSDGDYLIHVAQQVQAVLTRIQPEADPGRTDSEESRPTPQGDPKPGFPSYDGMNT